MSRLTSVPWFARQFTSRPTASDARPSKRAAGAPDGFVEAREVGAAERQRRHLSAASLERTAACRYESSHAKVAELADAQDSGSCGLNTRGGSSPPFRTSGASSSRSARVLASSFPRAGVNREYGGPIPAPPPGRRRAPCRAPFAQGVRPHRGGAPVGGSGGRTW